MNSCSVLNCMYCYSGECRCCDDIHDSNKGTECLSMVEDDYPCTDKQCYDRGNYNISCGSCSFKK